MNLFKAVSSMRTYGRPLLNLILLYLLQEAGLLNTFLEQASILEINSLGQFFIAYLLMLFGGWSVEIAIQKIWNKLSSISEVTLVETELSYAISTAIGTAIFSMIWLMVPFFIAIQIVGLILFISWPSILMGWILFKWLYKNNPEIREGIENSPPAKTNDRFWQKGAAYIIAAIVFNTATILSIQAILYLRSGKIADWWVLSSSCTTMTFILLVAFGSFIVKLGHKLLTLLNVKVMNERKRHGFAYIIGYMTILTVVVSLTLLAQYLTNPDQIMAWWAYSLAYLIIAICAVIAGISFGRFYTPPIKPQT